MSEPRPHGPGGTGTDPIAKAIEENVRAAVEESVRAAVEESVRAAAERAAAEGAGNGARTAAEPAEPDFATEPAFATEPVEPVDGREPEGDRRDAEVVDWDGRDEPPGSRPRLAGPLEAFLRHPFLTLLPVVLLVAGAAYLGGSRDAEYTSKARINVGSADVPAFYLQNVVNGNQALAASYARAIAAAPVTVDAARRVGASPAYAGDHLDASQVAGSTLIQVEATGSSKAAAIALANAGAEALMAYIPRVIASGETRSLFVRFKEAQAAARRAEEHSQRVLKRRGRLSRAFTTARTAEDIAQLRASELGNRYRSASGDASAASRLRLLAPAANADSDRREVLERLIVIGAVAGLLLGLGLALLRSNWTLLRSLRRR
ncbi:MAG TPA: hypothetical protein VF520_02935 [Thermoleophilaceae bacterium]